MSMKFPDWDRKTLKRNAIFALALLSLVVFMHEIFGRNGYMALRQQKKEYRQLQQQIQTISRQNQQLEQKIHALKNNPEAVEKQARDQLHLAMPGEIIYMLPNKKPAQLQENAQQTTPNQPRPQR